MLAFVTDAVVYSRNDYPHLKIARELCASQTKIRVNNSIDNPGNGSSKTIEERAWLEVTANPTDII